MNIEKDTNIKNWYKELFEELESQSVVEKNSELHKLRKDFFEKYNSTDFPNRKNEEWKYTDCQQILNSEFSLPNTEFDLLIKKKLVSGNKISDNIKNIFVFVNGFYSDKLSQMEDSGNISVINLKKAINSEPDSVYQYLSKNLTTENIFTHLNNSFVEDGIIISIKENAKIEKPIQFIYLNGESKSNMMISPRNIIILEKNSKAVIVESFLNSNEDSYFFNLIEEIHLGENASLERIKIINESIYSYHISGTEIIQKSNSTLSDFILSISGSIIRNDLVSILNGEGIECNLNGLYIPGAEELFDNHTTIDHRMPRCNSNQLYKGVLIGDSKAVFNGKIFVRKNAQKTNAYQSNKSLLLSTEAQINTKPQLEIFADDVKCSHGATVGQIDKDSLFYLQSRGISRDNALMLLIKSFVIDIIERISDEDIRKYAEKFITEKMKNFKI